MRRRSSRASANATRRESHLTSAERPRPRPCVAQNVSARWRRRCRSRARRRRTMPPPRTRASPPAPSRIAACTAPLLAFEGLAGEASLASCRPSSSPRRGGRVRCGAVLCATWRLARRQTNAGPALWAPATSPVGRHVVLHALDHEGGRSGQPRRPSPVSGALPLAESCAFTRTCALSRVRLAQHPASYQAASPAASSDTNAHTRAAAVRAVCPGLLASRAS